MHLLLILVTITLLIKLDLNRDQVGLHAVGHVLIGALCQHLLLVLVLDVIKSDFSVVESTRLPEDLILDVCLIIFGLLKLALLCLELLLLG